MAVTRQFVVPRLPPSAQLVCAPRASLPGPPRTLEEEQVPGRQARGGSALEELGLVAATVTLTHESESEHGVMEVANGECQGLLDEAR